jgi:NAD(P)H-dependent flavin oxidoreductase YrpB (nitropropane dioxygenase family)
MTDFADPTAPTAPGPLPLVVQGGMGIGVSAWRLARAVARRGQLGVVSGTGLDTVIARRLQDGDAGGHVRRAIARFPFPRVGEEAIARFFRPEGRPAGAPYRLLPLDRQRVEPLRERFAMLCGFVEVDLAREGHAGPVGINLLTKIQRANLPTLYGAMLAGVEYVLMGAGIPRDIPAALDALAEHGPATLRLEVEGLPADRSEWLRFDPSVYGPPRGIGLRRPRFLPIVSSHSLATLLARKASGRVDGFIVEGPTAGGHNAPPRADAPWNERGEPVYGARDEVDLKKLRELGLPFWLAGGCGRAGALDEAHRAGAAGIQVGTLFAYCEESGMAEDVKRAVLEAVVRGEAEVFTDPVASPTGYPFKRVRGPCAPLAPFERERACDLGYLRAAYLRPDGTIGHRCPSEPVDAFVRKGGREEDTRGRICLCNGLLATVGQPQRRSGGRVEPPLVTSGDDLERLGAFLGGRMRYGAGDVLDYLLAPNGAGGVAR